MKIQLLSDLHLEFGDYSYFGCGADVVVLAGDIHTKQRGISWAVENIRDRPVIYVLGNHEFYGEFYPRLIETARSIVQGTSVHLLENDVVSIDGVNFVGCTLWTDFELFGDPRITGYHCQQVMTDYRRIRRLPHYSRMRAIDTAIIHKHSLRWLDGALTELRGGTNIVVSHHGPSVRSVPVDHRGDMTMAAYVSDLEEFVLGHAPSYWIHGHLHASAEYTIGDCTVLCNPKGYPSEENVEFDSAKSIIV